ncbi:MAG: DHH family phosphoesterase [Oscillospiraceae bacterium]|nr:DHH family phosphoesterase [Oscillospiraceae bacterium]
MKNRSWGTDILIVLLFIMDVRLAVAFCVLHPNYTVFVLRAFFAVLLLLRHNIRSVRKTIRDLFLGNRSGSTSQQVSFEKLLVPLTIIEKGGIVWYNDTFKDEMLSGEDCYLSPVKKIIPQLDIAKASAKGGQSLKLGDREYTAFASSAADDSDLHVCYFVDDTTLKFEAREFHLTRPVVMHIVVDTYDEILKDMKESRRATIIADLDRLVEETAQKAGGLSLKLASSRYAMIIEERFYDDIVKNQFEILEKARNIDSDSVTLSVGVGKGGRNISANDLLSRQALDMALGRGGDQAVVKSEEGYQFYGGTLPSVEKRSKVRSRIVARALQDIMMQCDSILVMGHKKSDLDAVGSAIGMAVIANSLGKKAHIVIDESTTLAGTLVEKMKAEGNIPDLFITTERGLQYVNGNNLLVVVDTHSARMTESEELTNRMAKKVVIDHHRRMVDYISDTVVSYHEPYASSASELVTELMQYMLPPDYEMETVHAEALLSGIMLDTRNFTEKAGVRTYEAAGYLRRQGRLANEVLRFFSTTKEVYKAKSDLVNNATMYKGIAISMRDELPKSESVAVPQAANELLGIEGVGASIVAVKVGEQIMVSARSLGDVNVQVLMEYLGGGGHLNQAGVQLTGMTMEEARSKIMESIDNYRK